METIRVLVVDDQPVYRNGIRSILSDTPQLECIGEAGNGLEALEFLTHTPVDVVLLDINMPKMGGLEAVPLIQKKHPAVGTIMLTIYDNPQLILQFFNLEVAGYLLKEAEGKEIIDAIKIVAAGGTSYGVEIMRTITQQLKKQFSGNHHRPTLTGRELEVVKLIIQEYTAPEIAKKLYISKETVDTHRKNIREKLVVRNTAGIVREALRQQLVQLD